MDSVQCKFPSHVHGLPDRYRSRRAISREVVFIGDQVRSIELGAISELVTKEDPVTHWHVELVRLAAYNGARDIWNSASKWDTTALKVMAKSEMPV